jgi:hypothetical protein
MRQSAGGRASACDKRLLKVDIESHEKALCASDCDWLDFVGGGRCASNAIRDLEKLSCGASRALWFSSPSAAFRDLVDSSARIIS